MAPPAGKRVAPRDARKGRARHAPPGRRLPARVVGQRRRGCPDRLRLPAHPRRAARGPARGPGLLRRLRPVRRQLPGDAHPRPADLCQRWDRRRRRPAGPDRHHERDQAPTPLAAHLRQDGQPPSRGHPDRLADRPGTRWCRRPVPGGPGRGVPAGDLGGRGIGPQRRTGAGERPGAGRARGPRLARPPRPVELAAAHRARTGLARDRGRGHRPPRRRSDDRCHHPGGDPAAGRQDPHASRLDPGTGVDRRGGRRLGRGGRLHRPVDRRPCEAGHGHRHHEHEGLVGPGRRRLAVRHRERIRGRHPRRRSRTC